LSFSSTIRLVAISKAWSSNACGYRVLLLLPVYCLFIRKRTERAVTFEQRAAGPSRGPCQTVAAQKRKVVESLGLLYGEARTECTPFDPRQRTSANGSGGRRQDVAASPDTRCRGVPVPEVRECVALGCPHSHDPEDSGQERLDSCKRQCRGRPLGGPAASRQRGSDCGRGCGDDA